MGGMVVRISLLGEAGTVPLTCNYCSAVPDAADARRRASPERSATSLQRVPFAEAVCLTLITQGMSHGWAIGSALAPDGEVGRIWSLSRPLTYRAIDGLVDKGLVERRGSAAGRGRDRTVLAPTAAGRRFVKRWLDAPVDHLRDVRTGLLVKLSLRSRVGLDSGALVAAQQARFAPAMAALSAGRADDDFVDLWRRESAGAVRRFLEHAADISAPSAGEAGPTRRSECSVRLSARNQLKATVESVNHGEVMSTIRVTLGDGQQITAAITKDAAQELGLAPGDEVLVVVKSTEVMLAKE
jgi:molybdopterin-binding protein